MIYIYFLAMFIMLHLRKKTWGHQAPLNGAKLLQRVVVACADPQCAPGSCRWLGLCSNRELGGGVGGRFLSIEKS